MCKSFISNENQTVLLPIDKIFIEQNYNLLERGDLKCGKFCRVISKGQSDGEIKEKEII